VPLLYSPLYQSIRLILFGALSISSLAVTAAVSDDNEPVTVPTVTDNGASNLVDADNDLYLSDNIADNNSNLDPSGTIEVTDIQEAVSAKNTTQVSDLRDDNASNIPNLDDESIQNSLLSEFYQ
jgi:LPS-assembly protein